MTKEVSKRFTRTILQGGEIVLNLIAEPGHSAIVPPDLAGANVTRDVAVIPVIGADARFVNYCLQSPQCISWLRSHLQGSVTLKINLGALTQLPVPQPPPKEQRRITSVLGVLDDKIASNGRVSKSLERLACTLVDCVLSAPGTAAWPETTLGEILSVLETGNRPRGGVKGISEGVPSIGAESITQAGSFDFAKLKFVPHDYYDQLRRGRLQDRDVLLYKDGGKPGDFRPHVSMIGEGFPFDEAAINEHVYRLRVDDYYSQDFLYAWLRTDRMTDEMRRRGTGVAIPGLNSASVRSLPIIQPDRGALAELQKTIAPLMTGVLRYAKEARVLTQIRDALLPALVSGQLRVNDEAPAETGPPPHVELVAS